MGFIFMWENFREEKKSAKNAKITPTQKFPRLQYIDHMTFVILVTSNFFWCYASLLDRIWGWNFVNFNMGIGPCLWIIGGMILIHIWHSWSLWQIYLVNLTFNLVQGLICWTTIWTNHLKYEWFLIHICIHCLVTKGSHVRFHVNVFLQSRRRRGYSGHSWHVLGPYDINGELFILTFHYRVEGGVATLDTVDTSSAPMISAEDQELLSVYQHSFDDDKVDLSLVLSLLIKLLSSKLDG